MEHVFLVGQCKGGDVGVFVRVQLQGALPGERGSGGSGWVRVGGSKGKRHVLKQDLSLPSTVINRPSSWCIVVLTAPPSSPRVSSPLPRSSRPVLL